MPLIHRCTQAAFEKNVRTLHHENRAKRKKRSAKQILAIAYSTARRAAAFYRKKPSWLFRRATHRTTR
jgi:hypothetical protein